MLACGSEFQVEIEGPQNDEFLLRRQKKENDAESIFTLGDAEPDGRARGDGHGRNKGEQEKGKNPGSGNDAQGPECAQSKSEASQEHVREEMRAEITEKDGLVHCVWRFRRAQENSQSEQQHESDESLEDMAQAQLSMR